MPMFMQGFSANISHILLDTTDEALPGNLMTSGSRLAVLLHAAENNLLTSPVRSPELDRELSAAETWMYNLLEMEDSLHPSVDSPRLDRGAVFRARDWTWSGLPAASSGPHPSWCYPWNSSKSCTGGSWVVASHKSSPEAQWWSSLQNTPLVPLIPPDDNSSLVSSHWHIARDGDTMLRVMLVEDRVHCDSSLGSSSRPPALEWHGTVARRTTGTGLHRPLRYTLNATVPVNVSSCTLHWAQWLPRFAFVDVDEIAAVARAGGPVYSTGSRFIDVEKPTAQATQHVVQWTSQPPMMSPRDSDIVDAAGGCVAGSKVQPPVLHMNRDGASYQLHAELLVPMHFRYQVPSCSDMWSGCYARVHLPPPLVAVSCNDGEDARPIVLFEKDAYVHAATTAPLTPTTQFPWSSASEDETEQENTVALPLQPVPTGVAGHAWIVSRGTALVVSLGALVITWAAFTAGAEARM